ncbi:hypothetical protein C8R46DRAFT_1122089 [Mycena filopes]|nr:hypothetical protein C8R46DRAFT_1122089 [Mycena filopes]
MVPPHSLLNPHSLITTHFVTVLLLTIASFASGAVVDTTIDDTDSSFSWSDGWTAVGPSGCGSCATKPDVTKMQGQTYHDRSIVLSKGETAGGSFTFTGSAVRIYGIDEPSGSSNLVFTFNGQSTTYSGSGTDKFLYNALFFSASGLAADQAHTVNWALVGNPAINVDQQLAMFDYAVVTSGTPDTTSTGGSTTGGSTSSGSNSGDSSGSNTNTDNSGSTSGSNSGANSGSNNASSSGGSGSSEVSGSPTGKTSTSGSSTATSNGTPGTPS